jgi:hypothetical protein
MGVAASTNNSFPKGVSAMAVKKVPQVYETSDGLEFESKKQAERHEALIEARELFEGARERFGERLAQTQKTADGVSFEFGICRDYWVVVPCWAGLPRLRKIWFSYMGDQRFEISEDDEITLLYSEREDGHGSRTRYKISDLYYSEKEAKKALLAAQQKRLEEFTEEVEALLKEVTKES